MKDKLLTIDDRGFGKEFCDTYNTTYEHLNSKKIKGKYSIFNPKNEALTLKPIYLHRLVKESEYLYKIKLKPLHNSF